jgi:predicted RNA-binding protein (virulence factor B family)
MLKEAGGFLPYHDKSDPEEIYEVFGMSKKAFKMAVGKLYKEQLIKIEETGIKLKNDGQKN